MVYYLFQESREGRFAENLKQRSDRVQINTRDLWVGLEVSVITAKTKTEITDTTVIQKQFFKKRKTKSCWNYKQKDVI